MIESEVRQAAEKLFVGQDLIGYTPVFLEAQLGRVRPGQWTVLFEYRTAQGGVLDGPVVVVVDDKTGQAQLDPGP